MNEPIRLRPLGCRCDGSGVLADRVTSCPCTAEDANAALDRVTEERNQLAIANAELAKVVVDLQYERDTAVGQLRAVHAWLERFEAETRAVPCQAEDPGKGQCIYNWRAWFQRQLRAFFEEEVARG